MPLFFKQIEWFIRCYTVLLPLILLLEGNSLEVHDNHHLTIWFHRHWLSKAAAFYFFFFFKEI